MTGANYIPRRIASLQPSATVILARLGMLDRVVACTKWCQDLCPEVRTSGTTIIADSWSAKAEEILLCKPDLVIASVPYQVAALTEILKAAVPFLGLAPKSLPDVYADISLIARVVGREERGAHLIAEMQEQIEAFRARAAGAPSSISPRVFCEEWGKPLIHSQGWVAELVEAAGGVFVGVPGAKTSTEAIEAVDPDVMVISWCGAGDRVPLENLIVKRGWHELRAVKNARVYCINDEYLNTPAPTLIAGLQALAAAIHPEVFGNTAPGLRRIAIEQQVASA